MNNNMDIPEFTRLDLGVVWRLGRDLVEQCLQERYGVTICAKVGQQHVFHAALPGQVPTTILGCTASSGW